MSVGIDIQSLKAKLASAESVLVLFGMRAGVDDVASALAIYLSLEAQAKDVTIASPLELRAEFSRLVGLDKIASSIDNRDLVIGFPNYDFANIEKVTHNDGLDQIFELIIQPKKGLKAPNPDEVKFSHRGANADLIITVGVSKLEELDHIYELNKKLFSETSVMAFGRMGSPDFAEFNFFDSGVGSVAEQVFDFLEEVEMGTKDDVASNLLAAIDHVTNRFSSPQTSAKSFMMAGQLLEHGAKRQPPRIQLPNQNFSDQPSNGFMPFVPTSSVNKLPQNTAGANADETKQPPQEWLQPKIYKGGTQV